MSVIDHRGFIRCLMSLKLIKLTEMQHNHTIERNGFVAEKNGIEFLFVERFLIRNCLYSSFG